MTDTQIMIARGDATVTVDGAEVVVRSGESTAFATDPIVRDNPDLWAVFEAHYEDDAETDAGEDGGDSATTISTGDVTSLTTDPVPVDEHPPAAKDVRAWAKEQDIDVPARGPIPDEVVELYLEALGGNEG